MSCGAEFNTAFNPEEGETWECEREVGHEDWHRCEYEYPGHRISVEWRQGLNAEWDAFAVHDED
jgi:hypothetical protein